MKYFGLSALALAMSVGAFANSVGPIACNSAPQTAVGSTTFGPTGIVCPDFSAIAGATYNSITITAIDSFSQANGTLTYNFSYSGLNTDLTFPLGTTPNTCIAGAGASSTACQDQVTGFVIGTSTYQLAGTITDAANYIGASTWAVGSVSGAIGSGTPFANFSAGAVYYETLNYTPSATSPEPGSMMLLGSGLVAFAFAGRKLVRK